MPASPASQALGSTLRRLRGERGLTQEQVSDAAGITVQYLSNIERGVSNPTWPVVVALARALGLAVAELAEAAEAEGALVEERGSNQSRAPVEGELRTT